MKSEIEKLINALQNSFNGTPWYGDAMMEKLNKIEFEIINETPVESTHSVANLIRHIINWRVFAIEKLKGNLDFDIQLNTGEDWPTEAVDAREDWKALLVNLENTQEEILQLLKSKPDAFLKLQTPGRNYNYQFLVEGIIQHDIYHLGQIGLVAKQAKITRS